MNEMRETFFESDGVRLHYIDYGGEGPPLVLLGGLGGTAHLFRGLARLFGLRVTDPTSGFQALNRRVLEIYTGDFFPSDFPDVDVLVVAHRAGVRICEVAVELSELDGRP